MEEVSYAADVLAAHETIARYWAIVDGKLSVPVDSCFTNDCFLKIESVEISGQGMLVDAVLSRTAKAAEQRRSTRHLISNFFVRSYSGNALILESLITVFSGYGDKPAPLATPSSLGDFVYHCTKTETGEWKISRLEGSIVFAGSDSPFSRQASPDPQV